MLIFCFLGLVPQMVSYITLCYAAKLGRWDSNPLSQWQRFYRPPRLSNFGAPHQLFCVTPSFLHSSHFWQPRFSSRLCKGFRHYFFFCNTIHSRKNSKKTNFNPLSDVVPSSTTKSSCPVQATYNFLSKLSKPNDFSNIINASFFDKAKERRRLPNTYGWI